MIYFPSETLLAVSMGLVFFSNFLFYALQDTNFSGS